MDVDPTVRVIAAVLLTILVLGSVARIAKRGGPDE
jgi:hypothetical protein